MHQILVIDDESPTLSMFRHMLGAYGYPVITATSGEEGIALFEKHRPPIVVTDLKMPQMDGMAVLTHIKAVAPNTEVIVITGHGDMDLAIQALNLDATDFIHKPIQRRALEQALKRATERLQLAADKTQQIAVSERPRAAVITIQGHLHASSEAQITAAFDAAYALGRPRVVIHCQENTAVNGAGLAILGQSLLSAKQKGYSVALVVPALNLKKVFQIAGIAALAPLCETVEAAMAEKFV